MTWATPSFDEVKMDAEIGSYCDDDEPTRETRLVERPSRASRSESVTVLSVGALGDD